MNQQAPIDTSSPSTVASADVGGAAPPSENFNPLPKNATAEEVLNHNPFKPAKQTQTAKGPDAGPGTNTTPPPAAAAQPPASPAQAAQVTPNRTAEIEAIKAALMQGDTQPPQPPPSQGQAGTQDDPFSVNWSIPEQLAAGLFSGDPQHQGPALHALFNGVANGVLNVVKTQMDSLISEALPSLIERQMEMRAANEAFYGDFPHLKTPMLRETVGKVAQALARSYRNMGRPVDPMDPAFRDAVEEYIVQQGLVQRAQGWKHPRMSVSPGNVSVPVHMGSMTPPNGGLNMQQLPSNRNLLDEIGL